MKRASLLIGLLGGALALAVPSVSRACGGRAQPWQAFPGPGATDVSPQSSIFVTGIRDPGGLAVEAAGQLVAPAGIDALSTGPGGEWWRVRLALAPSTSYLVRGLDNGVPRELTRFTTAAAYDKTPGTAPKLTRLRLWRVRYPVEQIAAGGCVFSEYEGYVALDYQPGSVPATPDAEVLTVVRLTPKTGGATQSFAFPPGAGQAPWAQWENPSPNQVEMVPEGRLPTPVHSFWRPELAPDREYCVTVTLYGRNDLAAPPITSEPICAPVTNATWNAEGTAASAGSGGCAVGGGTQGVAVMLLVLAGLAIGRRRRC